MAEIPTYANFIITCTGLVHKKAYHPDKHELPPSYQVQLCEEYIDKYMKLTPRINGKETTNHSYHLKHAVEEWYGEYISEGAFILAAMNKGCQLKIDGASASTYFNLKKVPSLDSCTKFIEALMKKTSQAQGMIVHSKSSLWKAYCYYCEQDLRFFPHVKQPEFVEFISSIVQFDKDGLFKIDLQQIDDSIAEGESEGSKTYIEGASIQTAINQYERNQEARNACITIHGVNCVVCGFNFEKVYGQIGQGYIHVHHITQLSDIGREYEVDPQHDLQPVCPNCHAMLHKRKPPYKIEELQKLMKQNKR